MVIAHTPVGVNPIPSAVVGAAKLASWMMTKPVPIASNPTGVPKESVMFWYDPTVTLAVGGTTEMPDGTVPLTGVAFTVKAIVVLTVCPPLPVPVTVNV